MRQFKGVRGVKGDKRNGLMRPWKRGPLARASAAAMSMEMLLPEREWVDEDGRPPGVGGLVILGWTANRPLGVRDRAGRGTWGEGLLDFDGMIWSW